MHRALWTTRAAELSPQNQFSVNMEQAQSMLQLCTLLLALENTLPPNPEVLSVHTLPAGDLASREKREYNTPGVLTDAKM